MATELSPSEKHAGDIVPAGIVPLIPPTDPNLVTWDGPDDPENPKNWRSSRKWMAFVPMSLYNLLSSMPSVTVAPALSAIYEDFGFRSNTLLILSLSVYFLGSAIVPLFTAPISEMIGRIGSGMNSDLFEAHERGKALAVFTLAPLVGTAIGPITGGFLVQYVSWRWCFYVISIAIAAVQIAGLILLRETYGPVLLKRKAARLRKSTQNSSLHTEHDYVSALLMKNLLRPFCLLRTQPIIQVLTTFPDVWTGIYHESVSIGSLNYLSMTIGMAIATQCGVRFADKIYQRLKAKNNGDARPEFRLPMLCIVALVIPVGLFWYGWSARPSIHWIMPNIGAAIYSGPTVVQLVCVQGYLIDTYQRYAASAMANVMVLRNLLSFALPLVAPSLYGNLGFAWGNTLLACVAIVIGVPAPLLLWYYGEALRGVSPFARN
ncbi:major facilitator superfamily domain-containing protein [Aspergillus leporis]|uniref:Major facilitator superfamily domain-containing protein n=1 Tax=Aspergillus leporis TaxID=41062 RepID=A0A5N5XA57_9EURO|nr:major facilitator superfamily domain-containing protein [Aspergillus leporis]